MARSRNEQAKIEKRAEFLADKYGLSYSLTCIWCERNPRSMLRPMLPSDLAELLRWARVSETA